MKIAVVIPAYNEEENLPNLFLALKSFKADGIELHPIIVNDCSKDATAQICRGAGIDLIDLPVNLGIGGAVQSGMIYALHAGFDFAMQLDGDGQHPPSEIQKLVKVMNETKADIVIGSRFIENEGFKSSSLRRFGINYLKFIIQIFTSLKITDSTSGFRLYNRKALEAIEQYYPDEYPEPEAIIYFHQKGLKIMEAPVIMKDRQGGKSSISFINSIYYFWKVSLAIFYSYLKS